MRLPQFGEALAIPYPTQRVNLSAMKSCPRCTYPLEEVTHKEVELDHCRRCGGSYLGPEGGPELFGPFVDPAVWAGSEIAKDLGRWQLHCPTDGSALKAYEVAYADESVEIDLCPKCRGIWLDSEEGKALRDIVMNAGQDETTGLSVKDVRSGLIGYIFQLISQFPLEVWNPIHHRPRATLALIGLAGAVFLVQFADDFGSLTEQFALVPADIRSGRSLWTLLTSMFLHAGILHLAGNAYYLYVFGDNVEDYLGGRVYLALYFASGLAGGVLQVVTQGDPLIPIVGASAGVAGVMAAYLVIFPRVKIYQMFRIFRFRVRVAWFLIFWIGWNIIGAIIGGGEVAWMAHIGGFLAGALFAYPFRVRPLNQVFSRT
ncbi:MAG: rhomboid family intramembrane serine protease [Chloroflexi bacterium]|nr:rhomboid family intramembrane serine protease [Chloroflexota bacterium]